MGGSSKRRWGQKKCDAYAAFARVLTWCLRSAYAYLLAVADLSSNLCAKSNVVEDQLNVGLKGVVASNLSNLCQQEWCGLLAVDAVCLCLCRAFSIAASIVSLSIAYCSGIGLVTRRPLFMPICCWVVKISASSAGESTR